MGIYDNHFLVQIYTKTNQAKCATPKRAQIHDSSTSVPLHINITPGAQLHHTNFSYTWEVHTTYNTFALRHCIRFTVTSQPLHDHHTEVLLTSHPLHTTITQVHSYITQDLTTASHARFIQITFALCHHHTRFTVTSQRLHEKFHSDCIHFILTSHKDHCCITPTSLHRYITDTSQKITNTSLLYNTHFMATSQTLHSRVKKMWNQRY